MTLDWLYENGCDPNGDRQVMFKPAGVQYIKGGTVAWKSSAVAAICELVLTPRPEDLLIVEDDVANIQAIRDTLEISYKSVPYRVVISLALALGRQPMTQDEGDVEEIEDIPF